MSLLVRGQRAAFLPTASVKIPMSLCCCWRLGPRTCCLAMYDYHGRSTCLLRWPTTSVMTSTVIVNTVNYSCCRTELKKQTDIHIYGFSSGITGTTTPYLRPIWTTGWCTGQGAVSGVGPLHLTPWCTSVDTLKTTTAGRRRERKGGIMNTVCLTSGKLRIMSWEKTGTEHQTNLDDSF